MYSVVNLKGHQYKFSAGDIIKIDGIIEPSQKELKIENVLLFSDGKEVFVGTPYVDGACVKAQIVTTGKSDKITVFKKKRRKDYKKRVGHRQDFTEYRITEISMGNKKDTYKAKAPKASENISKNDPDKAKTSVSEQPKETKKSTENEKKE